MTRHSRCLEICLALLVLSAAPRLAFAQTTWRATVGAESRDLGRQALAFFPNEIWIHVGDSITWKFDTEEVHTVTFLTDGQTRPPFPVGCPGFSTSPATFDGSTCVTTPPVSGGATFTVSFPAAGNFKLVCLLHQNMTGTVHVLDFNEDLPHNQALLRSSGGAGREGDADGRGCRSRSLERSQTPFVERCRSRPVPGRSRPRQADRAPCRCCASTTTPSSMHVGDTVEWGNDDPATPHTITFGEEPANPIPPSGNVTLDPDGARHATISSKSDNVHSGFIAADPQERTGLPQAPLGVTRFRVTFTKAGVYPYICALHDELGMHGRIIVLP